MSAPLHHVPFDKTFSIPMEKWCIGKHVSLIIPICLLFIINSSIYTKKQFKQNKNGILRLIESVIFVSIKWFYYSLRLGRELIIHFSLEYSYRSHGFIPKKNCIFCFSLVGMHWMISLENFNHWLQSHQCQNCQISTASHCLFFFILFNSMNGKNDNKTWRCQKLVKLLKILSGKVKFTFGDCQSI